MYLGYMATEDGKRDKEIERRIEIARTAFESMAEILTSRNISIQLRLHRAVLHKTKTKRSLLNTIKKGNVNILDI